MKYILIILLLLVTITCCKQRNTTVCGALIEQRETILGSNKSDESITKLVIATDSLIACKCQIGDSLYITSKENK
jgi:hypothetical protein